MPELPEVARIAITLNEKLKGKKLNKINVLSGRYFRHGNPIGMDAFVENLPMKVNQIDFFGKLIIFEFENSEGKKWWCWNTLGMSGGWRSTQTKHGHVEFSFDSGSIWFTDVRNFGTLKFTDSEKQTLIKKTSIGPNHLKDEITDEIFMKRLSKFPNADICQVLMNQNLIGGIGNYIKAEILYRSGISPHRKVNSLTKEEFSKLNQQCKYVINSSFQEGGSSFKNYFGLNGESGNFPFFFQVYGRSHCDRGFKTKIETTSDKRTTYWVPELQK